MQDKFTSCLRREGYAKAQSGNETARQKQSCHRCEQQGNNYTIAKRSSAFVVRAVTDESEFLASRSPHQKDPLASLRTRKQSMTVKGSRASGCSDKISWGLCSVCTDEVAMSRPLLVVKLKGPLYARSILIIEFSLVVVDSSLIVLLTGAERRPK